MNILFFILVSCLLLGFVELLKRKLTLSTRMTRRMTHMGATIIAAVSALFISKSAIVTTCVLFAIVVFLSRKTTLLSSVHDIARISYGDVLLPVGEAVTALLFLPNNILAFQFGVIVMGIADACAGLIGERYGKKNLILPGLSKSTVGSITFFIVTLIITVGFKGTVTIDSVIIASILTVTEYVGIYGSDNLILPVLGAYLYSIYL